MLQDWKLSLHKSALWKNFHFSNFNITFVKTNVLFFVFSQKQQIFTYHSKLANFIRWDKKANFSFQLHNVFLYIFVKRSRSSHPEVFFEKGALAISQNSQENTLAGVRFVKKLAEALQHLLHKKMKFSITDFFNKCD